MKTKYSGNYIIDSALVCLQEGQCVTYPDTAQVEQFDTAEQAETAHKQRYPEQYDHEEYQRTTEKGRHKG